MRVRLSPAVAGLVRAGAIYHSVIPGATTNWGWRGAIGLRLR
jgi:hypothetical protein